MIQGKDLIRAERMLAGQLFNEVKRGHRQPLDEFEQPIFPPGIQKAQVELDLLKGARQEIYLQYYKDTGTLFDHNDWDRGNLRDQAMFKEILRIFPQIAEREDFIKKYSDWRNCELTENNKEDFKWVILEAYYEDEEETEGTEPADFDTFIRDLQLAFESDTEIRVKPHDQRSQVYSYKDLGFARETTLAWCTLRNILKSSDNLYHLGVAHGASGERNKKYDANKKILDEINKKLITKFKDVYTLQPQKNANLFELQEGQPPGTYGPKFTISNFNIDNEYCEDITKSQLIEQIEKLSSHREAFKTVVIKIPRKNLTRSQNNYRVKSF